MEEDASFAKIMLLANTFCSHSIYTTRGLDILNRVLLCMEAGAKSEIVRGITIA